ncbi:MAG: hypothetical protein ACHQ50_10710 [Fimbriimonadales bacterium]
MERVITATGEVGADHILTVSVPTDLPPGPVKVTVKVETGPAAPKIDTFDELLDSGLLGMWKDRTDLPVTNEEFIEWRRKLWERKAS